MLMSVTLPNHALWIPCAKRRAWITLLFVWSTTESFIDML